jgi:hypothetical protein
MRRFFAIGIVVGTTALALGACGGDDSGGGGNTGGTEGGLGGSGGIGGGSNNCGAYCTKLETAGCAPANCATDCSGKATCVPAWNSLVQCAATTGTVTCTGTTANIAGCDSQKQAYADCTSSTGGTGGGTGGTGGSSTAGSCQGNCDLPENTPVPDSDPPCYCDDACVGFGDCCDDKEQYCPSGPPPPSDVCKKFCCSASDCASGETCEVLSATIGTLGYCTSPANDGGTPDAGDPDATVPDAADPDATVPDAAPDAPVVPDAGGGDGGLPAGCVTGATPPCNPLTNAGCNSGTGEACDLGQNGLQCFPAPNDVQPGGDCDNGAGPYCIAGYHCSPP